MNLLTIAWKSLRQRLLASTLTGFSVALGVSLMVAVLVINSIITKMFSQSGTGYDLLVGPNGSAVQLVLSAVYRIDRPIDNLPWDFYEQIHDDLRIDAAVPIGFGDFTEVGGFPIIGTTPQYFKLDVVAGTPFQINKDGEFLPGMWDAVIGSEVARQNGWDNGTQFKMIHGGRDAKEFHVHDEQFTVKGVLAPTGTPNDRTVFVNLEGFFQIDGHELDLETAIPARASFWNETEEQVRERYKDDLAVMAEEAAHDHGGHDHGHDHGHGHVVTKLQKEVSAILVTMKTDPKSALPAQLQRATRSISFQSELKDKGRAQAVSPVEPMRQLLDNVVGNVRLVLLYLTGLIVLVAGISILVSIYNSMSDRKREIAVMRALGARRQTVFLIILAESLLLCVGGALFGLLLGHGIVLIAAPIVEARSGLLINPFAFDPWELVVIPVTIALAGLVGFLPGLTAYRTDVAGALSS
ncbi:MAG: ABC transporter permease [Planctomycetaceae bacterium]